MTCKQCKHITVCMVQVDGLGQVFDPNYDGEPIRCGNLDSWVQSWQQQMAFELENAKLSEKD